MSTILTKPPTLTLLQVSTITVPLRVRDHTTRHIIKEPVRLLTHTLLTTRGTTTVPKVTFRVPPILLTQRGASITPLVQPQATSKPHLLITEDTEPISSLQLDHRLICSETEVDSNSQ